MSWQNENHLRFALKGIAPDEIDAMCTEVGLRVVQPAPPAHWPPLSAKVPEGQWRYLMPWERF